MDASYVNYFSSSSKLLSSSLSRVTDAGQTIGVTTCFIVCYAEAPFCASKSCVAARAVLPAARYLALACHQLEKAYRCLCFCDCQWYKKLLVLCLSMTLQWSKILHSFKSTTPPKCFVVGLKTVQSSAHQTHKQVPVNINSN